MIFTLGLYEKAYATYRAPFSHNIFVTYRQTYDGPCDRRLQHSCNKSKSLNLKSFILEKKLESSQSPHTSAKAIFLLGGSTIFGFAAVSLMPH